MISKEQIAHDLAVARAGAFFTFALNHMTVDEQNHATLIDNMISDYKEAYEIYLKCLISDEDK